MGNQYDEMIEWEKENKGWDDPSNYPLAIPPQQPWPKIINRPPMPKIRSFKKYRQGDPLVVGDVVKLFEKLEWVRITSIKPAEYGYLECQGVKVNSGKRVNFHSAAITDLEIIPF